MPRKSKKPSRQQLESLYCYWLQGTSLRTIAKGLGVAYGSIAKWFRQEFGHHSTNIPATSLARSLVADYPGDDAVLRYAFQLVLDHTTDQHNHRSHYNLKQYTNFQTLAEPEPLNFLAYHEDPEPETEMTLYSFRLFVDILVDILDNMLCNAFEDEQETNREVIQVA